MNKDEIDKLLKKLADVYDNLGGPKLTIGICGGAALSLLGLIDRTTKDIDLVTPIHLPAEFNQATKVVADEFGLPQNWINQGPKILAEMGLPEGFEQRAIKKRYGRKLTENLASRLDLIFFKTYASVDRGGYHFDDLNKLNPTPDELRQAAIWCMTHDVSPGFKQMLQEMLKVMGHEEVSKSI